MSNPAGMRASRPQCRAVPAILTLIVIVLLLRVSTRRRPRTVASGELSAKIPTAKDVAEAEAEAEAGGDSEGETVAIPIPEHEFIDPTLDMEQALFEEKLALVVSVLYARGVFKVNVTRVPILLPLFQELAKARKYFVKGLDMRDYDTSCNRYFEDSASTSGAFDRGLYLEKEYLYKIRFRNRSEPFLTQPVCDRGSDRGCCLECNTEAIKDLRDRVEQARGSGDQQPSGFGPAGSELPSCCLCKFDGAKDLTSKILTPSKSSLKVMHWLQRGFQHPDEKKTKMRAEYRQVLEALGSRPRPDDEAGQLEMKRMTFVKNINYIPPGGFLMWHTNKYDNNLVPFRLYLISMDQDYGSSFKYILPDGTLADVKDYHGSVRLFTNTYTVGEGEEREEAYLWHTVVSERAHRHSLGFEITPELMVALLDTCDGCWDEFRALSEQYDDPLGGARGQGDENADEEDPFAEEEEAEYNQYAANL